MNSNSLEESCDQLPCGCSSGNPLAEMTQQDELVGETGWVELAASSGIARYGKSASIK